MSATRPPAFDDRVSTPIEASRRGAHRARPKPVSSGLPVIAGVVVVLLVIGGAYTLLGNDRSKHSSGSTVAAAGLGDDDPQATGTPAVGASNLPAGVGNTPDGAGPTSDAPTEASPSDQPSKSIGTDGGRGGAGVNRTINLVVLNSITVHGLAKKVQSRIAASGWKVSRTGNSTNRNLVTTKVYYAKSSQQETAKALADDLGYGVAVKDASVATKGLVVVLGQDAR